MNIFKIIFRSIWLYLKNMFLMLRVMFFPVWGQVLGIYLILAVTYYYSKNVFKLAEVHEFLSNTFILLFILIILVTPGFFIFLRAFWDYLVKMVSLNALIHTLLKDKPVKDLKLYNEPVNLRSKTYILFLLYISLIWIVLLALPGIVYLIPMDSTGQGIAFVCFEVIALVALAIISVYLSLGFQVFCFEEGLSAFDTLKKSASMVRGRFWMFVFLALFLGLITGVALPAGIVYLFQKFSAAAYLSNPIEALLRVIFTSPNAFAPVADLLKSNTDMFFEISNVLTEIIISSIVAGLILPLTTAAYTQAYGAVTTQKRDDERAVETYKKRAKKRKKKSRKKSSDDEDDE